MPALTAEMTSGMSARSPTSEARRTLQKTSRSPERQAEIAWAEQGCATAARRITPPPHRRQEVGWEAKEDWQDPHSVA